MDDDTFRLCLCARCPSSNQVECIPSDVQSPRDYFPSWLRKAPFFERVNLDETYQDVQQISRFKHYISMIIHNVDTNRQVISVADTSLGRMHHKIMIFDLIRMQEFELTLDHANNVGELTATKICNFWPRRLMLVDQNWALLVANNVVNINDTYFVLMLLKTDYSAKTFAVKDTLIIWDNPDHQVNTDGWTNFDRNEGPTCVIAFENSLTEHGRRRRDFALTLFISLDIHKQKLNLIRNVAGQLLNLPFMWLVSLIGYRFYGFETQRFDDGQQVAYMVNFNQILEYRVDGTEDEPAQFKQLQLPFGYEHELGLRNIGFPEIAQIYSSPTGYTLSVAKRPPFYNCTNTFILDIPTFFWHKLEVPGVETALRSDLQTFGLCLTRYSWFDADDQTLILFGGHTLVNSNNKRVLMNRWYRVQIRRPSSLRELALRQISTSNQWKSETLVLNRLDNLRIFE